tara:strand:+ start:351 stop:476 length:126 start_codon:yes stop_codon:yes gene_type:complete
MSTEERSEDEKFLDKIGKRIEFFIYTTLALSLMGLVGVLIF